ncbi:2-isopropylmalate synthase [Clostridium homopropionicum DSM 5847]|uniref:Citramalate synthase n=1 Tax=Clostridium homopropionicum DSM 5847 TaxID=1121318 RepID=A0A0L6ZBN2_9CLOT|nr:citramalate synthase [Clostridium homopropionicum]KOA20183.1 2-isopropylmalate synthase [Clostridium homopropionicum DSM 5847]SFG60028.1 2-isopropylmalate synthase [Clostridium homopropionicum]
MNKVYIFDTTLRDGAQAQGISFTVEDKLKILKKLDEFGIDYVEAGNPGSNPKDLEFFARAQDLKLGHTKLTAFGNTRRPSMEVEDDPTVMALANAGTDSVAIFGKSWDFHVTDVIKTTLEENINMIYDTLSYMKKLGKEVIFDAEHFFDGYKNNSEYAIETLKTAEAAGADWIVLCDTNGGLMPWEAADIIDKISKVIKTPLGIHCHNDAGMAVANTIVAVKQGVLQVQGTINGYGERCGNTNLCTVIPNLELKMEKTTVGKERLVEITELSRYINEITNIMPNDRDPYVGASAFTHKGGMHIDGVQKNPKSFEHVSPEDVGNTRNFAMSEVAGRSTILKKIQKVAPWVTKDSEETKDLMDKIKELEHQGYVFEGAEVSFELMVMKTLGNFKPMFQVKDFKAICDDNWGEDNSASSIVKVQVDGVEEITAAEGNGPVNALDKALRKALEVFYPHIRKMRLVDYKVRVLNTNTATKSKVRVHIESTDGKDVWGTVGVSTNIIEASWVALIDSIEYFLYSHKSE